MGRIGQTYEALHETGAWRARQRPTVPEATGAPTPPSWLDKEELKLWDTLLESMVEYNVIDRVDSFLLGELCQHIIYYQKVIRKIKLDQRQYLDVPLASMARHPLSTEADQVYKRIMILRSHLGMTPRARMQMNITQAIEVEKTVEKNAALSLLVGE